MPHDHSHPHQRLFDPAKKGMLFSPERLARFPPAAFLAALAPTPGLRFADLGAGTGYYTLPVLDALRGEGDFVAVDMSEEMLSALRERLSGHPHGGKVRLVHSVDGGLPLPDASVDAAVMGNFLHELDDAAAYLKAVRRAVAPGGRLLVVDWDVPSRRGPDAERVGPPYDHRIPLARATALLHAAGFPDVRPAPGFSEAYLLVAR
ncbi:MAG: class I SAM-dependent methyltransferase [Deltaproteobacteria bacterium]